MSLNVFMALCVLGCDFMIYVLFQWLYGEKRRKNFRPAGAGGRARRMPKPLPYVVRVRKNDMAATENREGRARGSERFTEVPIQSIAS